MSLFELSFLKNSPRFSPKGTFQSTLVTYWLVNCQHDASLLEFPLLAWTQSLFFLQKQSRKGCWDTHKIACRYPLLKLSWDLSFTYLSFKRSSAVIWGRLGKTGFRNSLEESTLGHLPASWSDRRLGVRWAWVWILAYLIHQSSRTFIWNWGHIHWFQRVPNEMGERYL